MKDRPRDHSRAERAIARHKGLPRYEEALRGFFATRDTLGPDEKETLERIAIFFTLRPQDVLDLHASVFTNVVGLRVTLGPPGLAGLSGEQRAALLATAAYLRIPTPTWLLAKPAPTPEPAPAPAMPPAIAPRPTRGWLGTLGDLLTTIGEAFGALFVAFLVVLVSPRRRRYRYWPRYRYRYRSWWRRRRR